MKRVITYGTYDMLHRGHVRLLERAKALGDYLVVGVTSEDFDRSRGKINVQQSLAERLEAVKKTGLADEVIVEEYDGQKIDDIKRYGIDIFVVGSDWKGKFDYLEEYCQVVYLDRTQGISSSELRAQAHALRLGLVGDIPYLQKLKEQSSYVNGITISGVRTHSPGTLPESLQHLPCVTSDFDELLLCSDAVAIVAHPGEHYELISKALCSGVHVLCETPVSVSVAQFDELKQIAKEHECVLMDGVKTAFATAYSRLLLLAKSGAIGQIVSVDATCTSLRLSEIEDESQRSRAWNSICAWGPTAMLPVFQLLGPDYLGKSIVSAFAERQNHFDTFTKVDFVYQNAVASIKVAKGAKAEGELVICGTEGYIYVPAPWWKTDYFEIRYEDSSRNRRYFYQLDGEGIRYELLSFLHATETGRVDRYIADDVSRAIVGVIQDFYEGRDMTVIVP